MIIATNTFTILIYFFKETNRLGMDINMQTTRSKNVKW